jgi:hypothetical protein
MSFTAGISPLLDAFRTAEPLAVRYGHYLAAFCIVPTVAAIVRDSERRLSVFLADLLLGWMVIGWILVLALAVTSRSQHDTQANGSLPKA